jgi:hypothetical protein
MSDLNLWYPGRVHDPAPPELWGTHADSGEPKFLLHATQGGLGVYTPDPKRLYYGRPGNWPNGTLARSAGVWRLFQHIPANRSSLSLRNLDGGVQTNRDNVFQVEIACRAEEVDSLPGEALEELARVLVWVHRVRGVPLDSTVRWVAYPRSYGSDAAQRLSGPAWDAYSGVLGHQHAPENDHGDPGDFPIDVLLGRARALVGAPATSEEAVTEQEKRDVARMVLAELRTQVFDVQPPIKQGNAGNVIGATYNKVGDVQARLSSVLTLLSGMVEDDAEEIARGLSDPAECDQLATLFSGRAVELRRAAAGG